MVREKVQALLQVAESFKTYVDIINYNGEKHQIDFAHDEHEIEIDYYYLYDKKQDYKIALNQLETISFSY